MSKLANVEVVIDDKLIINVSKNYLNNSGIIGLPTGSVHKVFDPNTRFSQQVLSFSDDSAFDCMIDKIIDDSLQQWGRLVGVIR